MSEKKLKLFFSSKSPVSILNLSIMSDVINHSTVIFDTIICGTNEDLI